MRRSLLLFIVLCLPALVRAASTPDIEEKTRALASELRCVVCQNLSVADSPSEMAQQMRAIVKEQLEAGKTPAEVKDFFVSKYGEWVLLKPKTSGFSLLLWLLPYVALTLGIIIGLSFMRRWARRSAHAPAPGTMNIDRIRSEISREHIEQPKSEDTSPRAECLRERARLGAELRELEFDFQAGKHSAADFAALRSDIENRIGALLEQLDALPTVASPQAKSSALGPITRSAAKISEESRTRWRRWQLAASGSFLLLFGLALGILLTQSLRPRNSDQDLITGDFLTGTEADKSAAASLEEGKKAFAQQEYGKAIDAFKRVLAREPNQPEAHSYMGFILIQAGHGDGALTAFDRALAVAPNFPMALWGKGMVLYREKQDYAGARAVLEKLLHLVPAGEERNEIIKVLAEIPASTTSPPKAAAGAPAAAPSEQSISGKITVDAKLKAKIDGHAALFIIVRPSGGAGGPPLAVKKIEQPRFPLSYSIGSENVMMQGRPFAGKVDITVRLDTDGNAMTREAGNLLGDYKKNPADVGSQNVDIVLDQIAQ